MGEEIENNDEKNKKTTSEALSFLSFDLLFEKN